MSQQDRHQLRPLLERSRGEPHARDALLEKLRPFLKALIRSWLGADLSRQLFDSDVVQEVSLSIHRNFASFRGDGVPEFLGWVRTIAFNAVVDHKKRLARERAGHEGLQDVPGRELSPLQGLEQAEDAVRLAAALELLPERRREVVVARLLEGLPYAAISQRSGTSEGALRIQFKRGLEQLRQLMETDQ